MQKVLIVCLLLLSGCYSYQGLSTSGRVVQIGKENVLIEFPCVNQKPFTKPCFGADYFEKSQFDTLYLGMQVQIK